ncbi:hypothetical protein GGR06_003445 [Bacteroides reticulotermitis]|uniref:Uncharacterized protein n=1 Tax=Bacteroides reticulotermitis TaxID=1133319 RepID=A0A840D0L5_9BACE|nr:hypothetical protein [Bacteroides reticulotermitis]
MNNKLLIILTELMREVLYYITVQINPEINLRTMQLLHLSFSHPDSNCRFWNYTKSILIKRSRGL